MSCKHANGFRDDIYNPKLWKHCINCGQQVAVSDTIIVSQIYTNEPYNGFGISELKRLSSAIGYTVTEDASEDGLLLSFQKVNPRTGHQNCSCYNCQVDDTSYQSP